MSLETGKFSLGVVLPEAMVGHCTAAINITHIFVTSGYGGSGKMAYIVDTTISPFKFINIGPLLAGREYASCGVASIGPTQDVHLIVAGGTDENVYAMHSLLGSEMYSLSEQRWKKGPKLTRVHLMGLSISNNKHPLMAIGGVNLFGGFSAMFKMHQNIMDYDAKTNSFKILPGQIKMDLSVGFDVIAMEESC